jgi:hypothetical protein
MDEYGCDFNFEFDRKPVVAIFPHPDHGRLIEKVIMVVSHFLCYHGSYYCLSWKDKDVCFYQPASPVQEAGC